MTYKVARTRRNPPARAEARGYPPIYVGVNRDTLTYGNFSYTVDETTAGVLPGIARTDYNSSSVTGSVTLNAPNTTFTNLNFNGDIKPVGANMKFKNCKFVGGVGHPAANTGCVNATGNGDHNGLEFEDCTFEARSPSYYRDGIVGNSYKTTRCISTGVNDGFGAFSNPSGAGNCDVEQWGCWAHDLLWWLQDPAHTDGTHNDACQYQGGSHLRIVGGRYDCYVLVAAGSTGTNTRPAPNGKYYGGSAIILNQNTHQASDVQVYGNELTGGYAQLQLNGGSTWGLTCTLGENRYGRDVYDNYPANPDKRWIAISYNATLNAAGLYTSQRWDDDHTLLTAGRTTGIRIVS